MDKAETSVASLDEQVSSTSSCCMFKIVVVSIKLAQECRKIRDPKGSPMFSEKSIQSGGVVPINRESDFNGYPQGGAWAEKAAHHLAGTSISTAQK